MGIHTHNRLIYRILAELDRDNSGGIDFDEFVRIAQQKHTMQDTRVDLRRAFDLFDWNGEGKINLKIKVE